MTSVFVRGFDFGTPEDAIEDHCSSAGSIVKIELFGRGAAVVQYSSEAEAREAVRTLDNTTIQGNTRFIDVKIDEKGGEIITREAKRERAIAGPGKVFIRGFEDGTTEEELGEHCSIAGDVMKMKFFSHSTALVTYSCVAEAEAAVDNLHGTCIEGQSRYIDVIKKTRDLSDEVSDREAKKPRITKGKGKSSGKWDNEPRPSRNIERPRPSRSDRDERPSRFERDERTGGKGGKKGGKKGGRLEDPPSSGRVFVRGFDHWTTEDQLLDHMADVGEVVALHWISPGAPGGKRTHSAVVVFKTRAMARKAVTLLDKTTIDGNNRYIDVEFRESE